MCKLENVPRIGEDSYKNVKNFAHPASREIPGQARNEAKKVGPSANREDDPS